MKTLHKTILFLGMVALLLLLPIGAVAEDGEMQGPECFAIGMSAATIAHKCCGAELAKTEVTDRVADLFAPAPVPEQATSVVSQDGRSTLRLLCTLLC